MENKVKLKVKGMHCAACEILLEDIFSEVDGIEKVKARLARKEVEISGVYIKDKAEEEIVKELTKLIHEHGYELTTEDIKKEINKKDLALGFFIAAVIFVIFFALQRTGIINTLDTTSFSYPFIFFIGIIASLSTCMAVVGGLVLSLSATYAKESRVKNITALSSFHISRIVSFFILGGILGLVGSALRLSTVMEGIITLLLALVMVILALNLLNVFSFTHKLMPKMPSFFFKKGMLLKEVNNMFIPVILGLVTFFLPCGFTQSMQFQALGSGNFFSGAMIMSVFALGTLPVLGLLSFASFKFAQAKRADLFFKTAGFLVIFFALLNIYGGLVTLGVIEPFLNI